MTLRSSVERLAARLRSRTTGAVERGLKAVPFVRQRIDREEDRLISQLERSVKPYRGRTESYTRLPQHGRGREEVLREMAELAELEGPRWRDGFVSGAVYHGDAEHIDFLSRVYTLHSQVNPLHSDLWPSASKYEAEIAAMAASMLGGEGRDVCGTVTSGGTESILLAMKAYRDRARVERRIRRPEIVAPTTAHVAFDKAARCFGMRMVRVPVRADFRADVAATAEAITPNTVVVVGSAPTFPHGVIDPIEELSEIARRRGIGFHTDACLGGFVLPWARELGYEVPGFDFGLPGVTSMSADTHKYGYAAKGTSVVLYRGADLRRYQYFTATDWPGGLYFSPTLAGSRPGALSAVCWAAMVATGADGYRDAARRILETGAQIRRAVEGVPELHVLGNPLWIVAFGSDRLDIYRVMDRMSALGWNLNGLHRPPAVHLCVTLRHTQPGVAERFAADLREAVAYVKAHPGEKGTMAPVYGLAARIPLRGLVGDLLEKYIDLLYRV
jgi:glutamate/tyrosine decarboxylase-like PLP-dependent enzyme